MSSARRLVDDCFLHDKDRLRHDEALALLRERVDVVVGTSEVPLAEALGLVLAQPVRATRDIPAFDNSAVDGYAFAARDVAEDSETWLPVTGRIAAGRPSGEALAPGSAVRIFTGAPMPHGADTVIMQEDARLDEAGARVEIPAGVKLGANRRRAGEDLTAGDAMLEPGARLRPQDIAAAASAGCAGVSCYDRLSIGVLSTGDEIVRPGTPLGDGQVYDANHYLLSSLLATLPVTVSDLGILPDDAGAVRKALQAAAAEHHVVLTTGGASRGEEDHVVTVLNEIGRLHAWQLAIKPGRPLAFGQIGDTVFLGLPGNPVAAMVCFLLYARPLLARLGGAQWFEPRRYPVVADFEIAKKKPDRREFLRGWLETGVDGRPHAVKYPRDGSGLISSLREADGLIELAEEVTGVTRGGEVAFIPFGEFGLGPRQ